MLLREVRTALAAPGPLPLLLCCSALISRPVRPQRAPGLDADELIAALAAVHRVESTAVLTVLGELGTDHDLRTRAKRHARTRAHPLPGWLTGLTPVDLYRAVTIDHLLGGGRTLLAGLRTGTGIELCLTVSTRPHPTGPCTETGALAAPVDALVARIRAAADDPGDLIIEEPGIAEVRCRLAAAAERPHEQPMIAWGLRQLPAPPTARATPGSRSSSTDEPGPARARIVARFLVAPEAEPLPPGVVQALLPRMLCVAAATGAGDPRRWGPDTVEHLLLELLPAGRASTVDLTDDLTDATTADLTDATTADPTGQPGADPTGQPGADLTTWIPELLRAFVRFGHRECGIRPDLTEQILAAIDRATLLLVTPPADPLPRRDERQALLGLLAEAVGGRQTLATLDTDPLPDEPLDLHAVPVEARDRVAAVAELVDRCCQTLFDPELRSACRRLLLDVAVADPGIFGPEVGAEATAATVVWAVAKANHRLSSPGDDPPGGGLGGWFGLEDVAPSSSLTTALLAALGITSRVAVRDGLLGSPRYLVADRRRQLIASRDRILTP